MKNNNTVEQFAESNSIEKEIQARRESADALIRQIRSQLEKIVNVHQYGLEAALKAFLEVKSERDIPTKLDHITNPISLQYSKEVRPVISNDRCVIVTKNFTDVSDVNRGNSHTCKIELTYPLNKEALVDTLMANVSSGELRAMVETLRSLANEGKNALMELRDKKRAEQNMAALETETDRYNETLKAANLVTQLLNNTMLDAEKNNNNKADDFGRD